MEKILKTKNKLNFNNMNPIFTEYLQYARNLDFYETPDYSFLK